MQLVDVIRQLRHRALHTPASSTRVGFVRLATLLALSATALASCRGTSAPDQPLGGPGPLSSDSISLKLTLHGITGTETLEAVAVAVNSMAISRASATRDQLTFFTNYGAPGQDLTVALRVVKGQTISIFAIEQAAWWGDKIPAPPNYNPAPADTAVDGAANEFASWGLGQCGNASLGDCVLSNVQNDVQITANFQKLASVNLQVIGVGQITRTITTRPPLTVAPISTANQLDGSTRTTSILFDSARAYAYEVALFSGSQINLTAVQPQGFTVHQTGWAGGCTEAQGVTCSIRWPATAGGTFTYPAWKGLQPPTFSVARFQYFFCTRNGTFLGIEGTDQSDATSGTACTLQSP
jgi:hypothetical protein